MADPYDLLPYTEHAYAESRPDNLRVQARLAGFHGTALPTHDARVLELGCGRGGNLLPLACAWPDASFVGVDRSSSQIRDASRIADAAALRNVSFVTADFTEASLPPGSFDFVLCHGVYSWVPVAARRALLERIRRSLAEEGVAYVSFNTLPGWYRNLAARDWMRFAARSAFAEGPRDGLRWLRGVVSPEHASYRRDLESVHGRLVATDAAYLTHEYLAEEHHPVHVSTFLAEAGDAGLTYLGDALPSEAAPELAPDAVRARAASLDLAGALQLLDFTRETAFRRALVVRTDTATTRRFRAPDRLDANVLAELRIASRLSPVGDAGTSDVESFRGAGTTVQASGSTRRALHALAQSAPRSIACVELARALGEPPLPLASDLYDLWLVTPGLDLHTCEPSFTTTVSERPRASAVARWHAIEGGPVTNVWHQEVELPESVVRFVLGKLDGAMTVDAVTAAVREREQARVSEVEAVAITRASLTLLSKAALLIA
jgi:SAM-dependent methyltransferase